MKRRLFLIGLSGLAGCTPARRRLNVFNWSNYVGRTTLVKFESETGIAVRYSVYESNEELLARVLSGNSGWDVVFPTHYYIEPMRQNQLLQPVDRTRLKHAGNLDSTFASPPWDPALAWSVPYMWGSTGILYHEKAAPEPTRWTDLWDERLRGRITMLDDPSEVLGAALKKLGLSLNETSEASLLRAQEESRKQKRLLRAYLNAEVRDQVVSGDVLACQLWATTAQQAIDAAPHLRFAHPQEGYPLYADCAVILRESQKADWAHQFIDFLLREEIAVEIVSDSRTATANGAARRKLPREISSLPALFPSPDTLSRGEWFATLPTRAQRFRDRLWTEIKAG